ncbi:MAG TPA: carboxypeptidase regulatory-like domain-containing protein, partial [Euryarchaeota archaeon]|nr:carboxypeptidase regulatory-like domain-containing protein [Euryarchaeota archaeon]
MAAALLTGFEASGEDEAGLSRFYGIVYESDGTRAVGEPVPGAEITTEQDYNLTGHYVNSTVSGEDGSFEMFLPGGDFKVTVMKDGYEPFSTSLKVVPGRDVNMDIFLVKKPSGAGVNLSSEKVSAELLQGESLMIHLEVMNTGTGTDTIIVEISGKMREWAS